MKKVEKNCEVLKKNHKTLNNFKKNMLMLTVKTNQLKTSLLNVMKELKLLKLKLKVGKTYYQIQKRWLQS